MTKQSAGVLALVLAACSPAASVERDAENASAPVETVAARGNAIDASQYQGKRLSKFLGDHPKFLIARNAVSAEALDLFSESDGIEIPGEVAQVGDRPVVIFATCGKSKCSTVNNIIAIDPENKAMHAVNHSKGRTTVIVDGPPDLAAFVADRCKSTACS